jgi:hypothetical protein
MARQFIGAANLDIRDSKPDWSAFLADRCGEWLGGYAPAIAGALFLTSVACWRLNKVLDDQATSPVNTCSVVSEQYRQPIRNSPEWVNGRPFRRLSL